MELSNLKDHQLPSVFFRYVMNSVIAMAALSFNVFTDTFFIANGIGSHALAPLNVALPMYSLITGFALMSAIGCATRYTLLKASHHSEEANHVFLHGFICAGIQSIIFLIIGLFFLEETALLLGAEQSILQDVKAYIFPLTTLAFLYQFNQLFSSMIRNDNAPSLAMKAMVAGNLVNIILDYIFIYHFHWGLLGASLASCCSPLTSLLILSTHRLKQHNQFHLQFKRLQTSLFLQIYRLGIPSFITELSSGIVMFAFNYMLLQYGGTTAIAAYGIIANLALIVQGIYSGVGQGIQPIVSYLYGCGKQQLAWKTAHYAILLSAILGIAFVGVGYVFPDMLITIFNSDGNVLLGKIARTGILLYFPAFLVSGINIVLTSFYASMRYANESTVVSLGRGIVFVLAFLFTLPLLLEEKGVWLSIPAAEFTSTLIACYFYFKLRRYDPLKR